EMTIAGAVISSAALHPAAFARATLVRCLIAMTSSGSSLCTSFCTRSPIDTTSTTAPVASTTGTALIRRSVSSRAIVVNDVSGPTVTTSCVITPRTVARFMLATSSGDDPPPGDPYGVDDDVDVPLAARPRLDHRAHAGDDRRVDDSTGGAAQQDAPALTHRLDQSVDLKADDPSELLCDHTVLC